MMQKLAMFDPKSTLQLCTPESVAQDASEHLHQTHLQIALSTEKYQGYHQHSQAALTQMTPDLMHTAT